MIVELETITWTELDKINRSQALVMIPLSPIEEHGPHLPLGTDIIAAADIAAQAAARLNDEDPQRPVVLSPALPLGCAAVTADFPGTLSLRGSTLRAVVCDICRAWVGHGFKNLLICNHHLDPVHMKAILSAIRAVEDESEIRIAETMSRTVYAGAENEAITRGRAMGLDMRYEIHADAKETAYIQYRRPELFRAEAAADLDPVRIDVKKGMRDGYTTFKQMGAALGYLGTPRAGDAEYGQLYLDVAVRQTVELAMKLVNGEALPPIHPKIEAFLDKQVKLE
ncbi:creatininase family protein [Desulfosarcina ovata]|nr:creatininase family protein [Desulfosarcina ovata]